MPREAFVGKLLLPIAMDCCCSFFNTTKPKIKIIDETPKGSEFDYLRPEGKITYSTDSTYDVPKIEIAFDGWYVNSVRPWPKSKKVRSHFLMLERTPPVSPQISFTSGESGVCDTVFWLY